MEDKMTRINVQYDKIVSNQLQLNQMKLKPINEAVLLCSRQKIALRDHRDDSKYLDEVKYNPGNLQPLLSFLVRCGQNKVFDDHIATAPHSATYWSKTTQNALIHVGK